jgi:uncharacterized protein YgbK (DUF1537 family)
MTLPASILVLADDLTGAAEIAAIGADFGLSTSLRTAADLQTPATGAGSADTAELEVLDTDTRPLSAPDAAARIASILQRLGRPRFLFKKTDSVLRGQIAAELSAILSALHLSRALLVPQNPSKRRIIRDGRYLIDAVPLDQTSFREDPEYPRTTSEVLRLLTSTDSSPAIHLVEPGATALPAGISIANASTDDHVRHWAEIVSHAASLDDAFPAGGADFFRAILHARGLSEQPPRPLPGQPEQTLLLCGSASDYSRGLVAQWHAQGLPVCAMPESPQECAQVWAREIAAALDRQGGAIAAIRHPLSPARAVDFRRCMAGAVGHILGTWPAARPLRLIVEGGATAAALTDALGWSAFQVLGSLAPGVVLMQPRRAPHMQMLIKPGSYPWPPGFPERSTFTSR